MSARSPIWIRIRITVQNGRGGGLNLDLNPECPCVTGSGLEFLCKQGFCITNAVLTDFDSVNISSHLVGCLSVFVRMSIEIIALFTKGVELLDARKFTTFSVCNVPHCFRAT